MRFTESIMITLRIVSVISDVTVTQGTTGPVPGFDDRRGNNQVTGETGNINNTINNGKCKKNICISGWAVKAHPGSQPGSDIRLDEWRENKLQ